MTGFPKIKKMSTGSIFDPSGLYYLVANDNQYPRQFLFQPLICFTVSI
jgi:hypothetical protein